MGMIKPTETVSHNRWHMIKKGSMNIREAKCDKDILVMNAKKYSHTVILSFLLVWRKVLVMSYLKSGKTPPEEEPLKSILDVTELKKWHI